jgi:hypothetical protein
VKLRVHHKKQSKGLWTRTSMHKTAAGTGPVHACSSDRATHLYVVRPILVRLFHTRGISRIASRLQLLRLNERRKCMGIGFPAGATTHGPRCYVLRVQAGSRSVILALCGAVPFFFSFFCLLLAERSSEMDMDGCVPHHGGTENVQRYLGQGKAATSDDEPATRLAREGMLDRLALVVVGLGKAAATGSTASACR